ncbi:hypothetical protein GCWU000325_02188 [Alloprevotella tannerae ATCC 51259]|jgi:hypothetical protein|uniref:Uncharacterized protein n=1 Tax=Alloprevotella tannerae ATCC 51259 TaxID=626522 RepID=C9LIX7_9BACT|nr:hypothetical protein GCWU000325_02188 [Alloprevotella tannerae ATCC 51259]
MLPEVASFSFAFAAVLHYHHATKWDKKPSRPQAVGKATI